MAEKKTKEPKEKRTIEQVLFAGRKILNECWLWTKATNQKGYGAITYKGLKEKRVHRISYMLYVGKIKPGLSIDHLCRNRNCFNPNHLEAVTNKENIIRGHSPSARNKRKTKCKNDHALSGENLVIRKGKHGPERNCRLCLRAYKKQYRLRRKKNGVNGIGANTHIVRGKAAQA